MCITLLQFSDFGRAPASLRISSLLTLFCTCRRPFQGSTCQPRYGDSNGHAIGLFQPYAVLRFTVSLFAFPVHGETVATYETAQTRLVDALYFLLCTQRARHCRQFYRGRTECVRTASTEAKRWCVAMQLLDGMRGSQRAPADDAAANAIVGAEPAALDAAQLLMAAVEAHNRQMMQCTNGQGIDRHMFGLRILAAANGLDEPAVFADECFKRASTFKLSTSQVHFPLYTGGFSAVTTDGYGVCYSAQPSVLRFSIAGWRSSAVTDLAVSGAAQPATRCSS